MDAQRLFDYFWKAYDLATRRRRLLLTAMVGGGGSFAASELTPEEVAWLIHRMANEIMVRAHETAHYMEAVLKAVFAAGLG